MIPSLASAGLKDALIEYLTTTYAIGDDETREELERFLSGTGKDDYEGIFRGPFVRIRPPFRSVPDGWSSPLGWLPEGFRPYVHQDRAHRRLSSLGNTPKPTLITTGTGSGKTECFLHPILDHCARDRDQRGIKAIILYPMNALANDQARRLAKLIHSDERLSGIRAGLFIGQARDSDFVGSGRMTEDEIITDHNTLRELPPDILLTNYRMLDLLLLRQKDAGLWRGTGPDTLRYLVLDEFHTYDGAQGTDVAMLLRRLGARLGLASGGRPLGEVAPVATSATLGGGVNDADMRDFAGRVFGVEFDYESLITEDRQSAEESLGEHDLTSSVPALDDLPPVQRVEDLNEFAAQFIGRLPDDAVDLGEALLGHRITWAMFELFSDGPRRIDESLERLVAFISEWGADLKERRDRVEEALHNFIALLSVARRPASFEGGDLRPLFSIEVQVWVRAVSRMLRALDPEPAFRWFDDPGPGSGDTGASGGGGSQPKTRDDRLYAPAVYCASCGRTGWRGRVSEVDDGIEFKAAQIYRESARRDPRVRTLILASEQEPNARFLDLETLQLLNAKPKEDSARGSLPVLVTPDEKAAKAETCPACDSKESIIFIGSGIAPLASVVISDLFRSDFVEDEGRKLLAFSDSIQDASHRSSYFNARTHRFGMRSVIAEVVASAADETLNLSDLATELMPEVGPQMGDAQRRDVYRLIPPDLLDHGDLMGLWRKDRPFVPEAKRLLQNRLELEAQLEFGLRARQGRTLELVGSAAARVDIPHIDDMVGLIAEIKDEVVDQLEIDDGYLAEGELDPHRYEVYLHGLLERLRLTGAIYHRWLDPYIESGGKRWRIWGGRPDGMPAFPSGISAPAFLWDGDSDGSFNSIAAKEGAITWVSDWAMRSLGVTRRQAQALNRKVLGGLANGKADVVRHWKANGQTDVYGLHPASIRIHAISDPDHSLLRCDVCSSRHAVPEGDPDQWIDAQCLRYRCPGRYREDDAATGSYYRNLYARGSATRVVSAEHVGGLSRSVREQLEESFKKGDQPDSPNVLSCTPTLEMGVDIGDLDSVVLASIPRTPASYLQRVGRAGRRSGNSLVTTLVKSDPRSLYFLERPHELIDGEVRSPNCWLDAIEILRRQYFAFLMDRAASGDLNIPDCPNRMVDAAPTHAMDNGFFKVLLDQHDQRYEDLTAQFLSLFGDRIKSSTKDRLLAYARDELRTRVTATLETWQSDYQDSVRKVRRMHQRLSVYEGRGELTDAERRERDAMKGEREALRKRSQVLRSEMTYAAIERLGLLPNYNLSDESVEFRGLAWSSRRPRENEGTDTVFESEEVDIRRSAPLAIREFAPGASVYTAGKRFRVDALPVAEGAPRDMRVMRICPECAFVGEDELTSCPRCGTVRITDVHCRHQVMQLTSSSSIEKADDAHVGDRRDERERAPFGVAVLVDIDPEGPCFKAWRLPDKRRPFGVEYVPATVHWINLGKDEFGGEPVEIAGYERRVSRFEICNFCGVVQGAKPTPASRTESQHRSSCPVRSGSRRESSSKVILSHTLETEVVRMMLPLADFEADERIASFKAALMLGLKLNLGGSPDHIEAIISTAPGAGDRGARRRYLDLRDTVPGGTGYLERLADHDELGRILAGAREAIARCPCHEEGRAACYRCLLGEAEDHEHDLVRRTLALEMLDDLIERWQEDPESGERGPIQGRLSSLKIGHVEESELERRLRQTIIAWADTTPGVRYSMRATGATGQDFDLWVPECDLSELREMSATDREKLPEIHYVVREQRIIDSAPQTKPDFVIECLNRELPLVALYSDGYLYHAAPEIRERLADDARKRTGARVYGARVWNMNWDDVVDCSNAIRKGRSPEPIDLVFRAALKTTNKIQHVKGGRLSGSKANLNPLELLFHYLCKPDAEQWRRLARSVVAGISQDKIVERGESRVVSEFISENGLEIRSDLDLTGTSGANDERWTVRAVLDDSESAVSEESHKPRWREWLWWANLLQFLDGDGCQNLITVKSIEATEADSLIPVGPPEDQISETESEAAELDKESLELADESCRPLIVAAVKSGLEMPIIGFELQSGEILEAAWPQAKVAITLEDGSPDGWDCRMPDEWDVDSLRQALSQKE